MIRRGTWFAFAAACTPIPLAAFSCGGSTSTSEQGGADGSLEAAEAAGAEGFFFDTSTPDVAIDLGYVVIDGGGPCDMATLPEHHVEIQTCCNGAMCQGRCVLFSDATAPECFCAGQTGGCPGPMVCCEYDVVCGVGQCCTGRLSCQTDHGL